MSRPASTTFPAPDLARNLADIQAILGSGFGALRQCRYLLLRVKDPQAARRWLRQVLDAGLVKSVADLGADPESRAPRRLHGCVLTLAFSHRGLMALGVRASTDFPFPSAFSAGMVQPDKSALLGDRDPGAWQWADAPVAGSAVPEVHLLAACFSHTDVPAHELTQPGALEAGFDRVGSVAGCPEAIQPGPPGEPPVVHEPFGFRDGLSQPVIRGLRQGRTELRARLAVGEDAYADRVVEPGEFILGHRDGYGELAHCPQLQDWETPAPGGGGTVPFGMNGSYLVARQIVQHVDRFRAFERRHPAPEGGVSSAAEKMVGRRKEGDPLVQCPFKPRDLNDFRYREADFDGLQCPRGAHVRRSHPRDLLGNDVESGIAASKLHRLLRRGRVYTDHPCRGSDDRQPSSEPACSSVAASAGDRAGCGTGLFFLAMNADLERQFELVQTRWINNRRFNDLSGEDDFTAATGEPHEFTVQGLPSGRRLQVSLEDFTTVVGGGYFFVPGLQALAFLATPRRAEACSLRPRPGPAPAPA
jgi:putative iron-dependent peroxidase